MTTRYQAVGQGGPFEAAKVPIEKISDDEILIKVKVIALNPLECKQFFYGFFGPRPAAWPVTLGSDAAGIVEAVGSTVTKVKVGDEVVAYCGGNGDRGASYQESAVIKNFAIAPKPSHISFEEGASIPLAFLTASAAVYGGLEIAYPWMLEGRQEGFSPRSILVVGASSSVGAAIVQLIHLALPYTKIIASCSPQHHDHVKTLGASVTLDYKSPDIVQQIRLSSPTGEGVEAIADSVNGVALSPSMLDTLIGPKRFAEVQTGRNVQKVPEGVAHFPVFSSAVFGAPGGSQLFHGLGKILANGSYKVPIKVESVGSGFEAIQPGLEKLNGGVSGTKLVVSI